MAVSLREVEAWLPSEFLTQEELLMGTAAPPSGEFKPSSLGCCFPTEFPYDFDSLGEDELVDEEEDDDEEEEEDAFFAGLTRRLTQQQLAAKPERKRTVVGSPESTLCGTGSCWSVSSNGSPNGAPSPPATPFGGKDDTLELIHAAAGEIARLKLACRNAAADSPALHAFGRAHLPDVNPNPNPPGYLLCQGVPHRASLYQYQKQNQLVGQQQQDQLLKQQYVTLLGKQQQQQPQLQLQHQVEPTWQTLQQQQHQHFHFKGGRGLATSSGRPLGCLPPSTWAPPPHFQSPINHSSSAGVRPVFVGGSGGVKRERAGTGVFLPRRYGSNPTPDSNKRKTGGSTVLVPAKVMQALNLNFDDRNMQGQGLVHTRPNCGLGLSDYDVIMARRAAAILAQQKQGIRPEGLINQEPRLPQEWTY